MSSGSYNTRGNARRICGAMRVDILYPLPALGQFDALCCVLRRIREARDVVVAENTIDIEIADDYGCLRRGVWAEIPKFAVVTGENGVGKSQLLAALGAGLGVSPLTDPEHRVPSRGVSSALHPPCKAMIVGETYPPVSVCYQLSTWAVGDSTATEEQFHQRVESLYRRPERDPKDRVWESDPLYAGFAGHNSGASNGQPSLEEFRRRLNPLRVAAMNEHGVEIRPYSVPMLFLAYELLSADLRASAATEDEIEDRLGIPPCDALDAILNTAKLPFCVVRPPAPVASTYMRNQGVRYTLNLMRLDSGAHVGLSELSSGERVIISTLFWAFSAEGNGGVYRLLILDEPDAHLHPSLVEKFLNVVKREFVEKNGVRVIMTTHSPSTVAIAPEGSLFLMERTSAGIPRPTTRDVALKRLTAGVPALSVQYVNRRQVFVESPDDVGFYEALYRTRMNQAASEISLDFIAIGKGKGGGCELIKSVVQQLTIAGNPWVFGLIDRDDGRARDDNRVLLAGRRHSIENYIFDAIVLSAYLYQQRWIDGKFLELKPGETLFEWLRGDTARLASVCLTMSDRLLGAAAAIDERLCKHANGGGDSEEADVLADLNKVVDYKTGADKTGSATVNVKYVGGLEISQPSWLSLIRGHSLAKLATTAFPDLKRHKRELYKHIVGVTFGDHPSLVPADIAETFERIQAA
jgi:predicted ATPase